MNMLFSSPTRFSRYFLWTLVPLSVTAFAALGLVVLNDVFPGSFLSAHLRGQLFSLGHLTFLYFVLLPGVAATVLLLRNPTPSAWMWIAGPIWALGALFLGFAFLVGGLEAGWSYALTSPITRNLVSPLQLLALLCATLSTEILVLQMLVQGASPFSTDFQKSAPAVASRILALALPVQASVLLVALLERVSGMELFSSFAVPLLPAYIHAWSWTPILLGLLLLAASVSAHLLAEGKVLPTGHLPLYLGGLSLFTPQLALLPGTLPSFVVLCGLALHCLLAACAWSLGFRLLPPLFLHARLNNPHSLLATAALAFTGVLLPLHLWINLLEGNGGFPFNPWVTATHSALLLASGLALLAPWTAPGAGPARAPLSSRWRPS